MSDRTDVPLLISLAEARRILAVGKTKLNQLCNAGRLDRRHIDGRAVVLYASVLRFVAELEG